MLSAIYSPLDFDEHRLDSSKYWQTSFKPQRWSFSTVEVSFFFPSSFPPLMKDARSMTCGPAVSKKMSRSPLVSYRIPLHQSVERRWSRSLKKIKYQHAVEIIFETKYNIGLMDVQYWLGWRRSMILAPSHPATATLIVSEGEKATENIPFPSFVLITGASEWKKTFKR